LNKSQTRREELLAHGRALFSTRAYDELSIDEIAEAAGVAKGLLYYYFGSKRGYYVAVIGQAAAELRERVSEDAALPPLERLAHGLDAYLGYAEESPEGYRALMAGGIGADPEVREIVARERRRFLELIAAEIGPAGPALPLALEGWFSFIEGSTLEWLERPAVSRDELRDLLLEVLGGAVAATGARLG